MRRRATAEGHLVCRLMPYQALFALPTTFLLPVVLVGARGAMAVPDNPGHGILGDLFGGA
jgi:hypothetical protein